MAFSNDSWPIFTAVANTNTSKACSKVNLLAIYFTGKLFE